MKEMKILGILLTAALTMSGVSLCLAQGSKTVRFIVPLAAGGSYDTMARVMGDKLSQGTGQTVVVENMPGAAMLVGTGAVARAAPDGQTIGLMLSPVTVQPSLLSRMPFDINKDLAPVTLIGWNYNVLVIDPSLPVKSVPELIAYLKANPNTVNFGSGGTATPAHLAGELFKQATGTTMVHVPYRGLVNAIQDLLAGRIQVLFGNASDVIPQILAGKVRALAVVGDKRLSPIPDVPNMAELGMPQIAIPAWAGIVVAAGTPPDIIARLHKEVTDVLALPEVRQRLETSQTSIETSSPEVFGKLIASDIERWGRVVKEANIKTE
jgi:tripartite-type tricarboxylate transporter receptor subunit TctC